MPSQTRKSRKNKRRKRRVSRLIIVVCAVIGALFAVAAATLWPGVTSALLLASGVLLIATLVELKHRSRLVTGILIGLALASLAAGIVFNSMYTCVEWQIFPLQETVLDLSGQELEHIRGLERLRELRRVNLSDNHLTAADQLTGLPHLEYVDLTGNDVEPDAIRRVRAAVPSGIVLCDTPDTETTSLDMRPLERLPFETLEAYIAQHTALTTVNVTDCGLSVSQLAALTARFPNIFFIYDTTVYGQTVSTATQSLALDAPDSETLIETLGRFRYLRELTLTGVTLDTVRAVQAACPYLTLTFEWDGITISPATTRLMLGAAHQVSSRELMDVLACAPSVGYVDLMDQEMNAADVKALTAVRPDVTFLFGVNVLGMRVSSDTTKLDFGQTVITDGEVAALADQLAMLTGLTEVDMYESDLSDKNRDFLFDSFPNVFFGWTLKMDDYVIRTDQTAFSTNKGHFEPYYTQDDFKFLRYCTRLEALDLGHNHISDISFLKDHPHLKVLILADNRISDISPLRDLMELQYLELFINDIVDFSPLANHTSLLDLNLCYNPRTGRLNDSAIEPLFTCTGLERCWMATSNLTYEARSRLTAALPRCQVTFMPGGSTDGGWREHARYFTMREGMTSGWFVPFE